MAAVSLLPTGEDMARKNGVAVLEAAEREIIITIPLGIPPDSGYEAQKAAGGKVEFSQKSAHVDAQLGAEAAVAFLRIRNGLRDKAAKLLSGRPVWSNADALRWLMEQVAAEVA